MARQAQTTFEVRVDCRLCIHSHFISQTRSNAGISVGRPVRRREILSKEIAQLVLLQPQRALMSDNPIWLTGCTAARARPLSANQNDEPLKSKLLAKMSYVFFAMISLSCKN
jgi:hypothetical protein